MDALISIDNMGKSYDRKSMTNVLYVFDDNYAPHAGVSITSLIASYEGSADELRIFCCGMGISDDNVRRIDETVTQYGVKLVWIPSDNALGYINSSDTGYWNGSKATWLKVFCIWDLPEDVERILYIDCDTVITGDISKIMSMAMNGKTLAMAYDSLGNTNGKKNFGLEAYYNAGVILFDVAKWKSREFRTGFTTHLMRHAAEYRDNEQGIINDYLRNDTTLLPLKYNMQGFLKLFDEKNYLSVYNDFPFYGVGEIREAKDNPVICHFFRVFGQYPWEKGNTHPYRELYEEWKEKSLWKEIQTDGI